VTHALVIGPRLMNVLLVEDDAMLGASLQENLQQEGHRTDWLQDGLQACAALRKTSFDLVLLDLGLGGCDGIEVLRELRAREDRTPVVILTARDQVSDRVDGLDSGADDYLIKPFDLDELLARIRVIARRQSGSSEPHIRHMGVTLDPYGRKTWFHGEPVSLTTQEYSLLLALLERPGRVWSRQDLIARLGRTEEVHGNAIEVHVHAIRRKLSAELIRSARGVGYFTPKA
jgi:DNA-binding response OmpR family regulator